jgi:transposase
MTYPGVGPITGLAYFLVIGTPDRFPCGKQLGSYTGLIPCEDSSAGHQESQLQSPDLMIRANL